MQFNAFFYILALVAIVHGAAIGTRAPSWANMAGFRPGNPPSSNAPVSGQASTSPRPVPAFQPGGCNCAGVEYSPTMVSQTLQRANLLRDTPIPNNNGGKSYPHHFQNQEKIKTFRSSLCAGPQLMEFPLTKPSLFYAGAQAGLDRIVYMRDTGMFCGCIYHINSQDFDTCLF